ncbi:MAG: AMP-binding protein [Anaerolineae bacterium]|nr:AMP-binding protein [Anaerolineae bacterium]MBT7190310.1 AMP-binding protein [Anaerolineae bacterium]MBT7990273.1 AMP-binding protein [Anaerolineae bacterium]
MRQHNIPDFDVLMRRSTEDVSWFTDAVLKYLEIEFYKPYTQVADFSKGIQWAEWCVGGQMNIVHNCVDKRIGTPEEENPAFIWESEEGKNGTLSYGELHRQVNQAANALRSLGLGKGDAVGIYMPMIPEIVVALLAIAKIGGIILPLFSGYGVSAVTTRLVDADAKALFTADGVFRRGKPVDMKSVADQAADLTPTLKHMIVVNRIGLDLNLVAGRDHWWDDLVDSQPTKARAEVTDAEDTLMIIYTSGTTGRPKGAVHTHCGFPIKAAQDMAFGTDLHQGETLYWMSDMGWMMGPWLVLGALILGSTFFIYDGAPDFPAPDRLWEMVEKHKIATLGISPTLVRALIPKGDEHWQKHDLSSLRFFASTGEPWNPDPWMWLFEKVGSGNVPIINYSGGTEISGGIVMGNPILPLKACAFSAPCPGIAADVVDEKGESVTDKVGELVIRTPWIGMTRGFWKDPERYIESYWSQWKDVWVHGDFAAKDSDGLWYILGRSDDTIKVAGKRLGPAEVESILVEHESVIESAAIGVPHPVKGSAVVVFAVLGAGVVANDELKSELRNMVATAMGKPLSPQEILFISDLPKTRNGKVMRRMIRSAYLGLDLGDTSALVNGAVLEEVEGMKV